MCLMYSNLVLTLSMEVSEVLEFVLIRLFEVLDVGELEILVLDVLVLDVDMLDAEGLENSRSNWQVPNSYVPKRIRNTHSLQAKDSKNVKVMGYLA